MEQCDTAHATGRRAVGARSSTAPDRRSWLRHRSASTRVTSNSPRGRRTPRLSVNRSKSSWLRRFSVDSFTTRSAAVASPPQSSFRAHGHGRSVVFLENFRRSSDQRVKNKRFRPDGGETASLRRWLFRSFAVIRR